MLGISFDGNSIFNGVVGSVAAMLTVWAVRWAGMRLGLLNDRLTLRIHRAELAKVEALARNPAQTAVFLLTCVVICLGILGIGLAYAPIAFMDGGAKWIAPFLAVIGLAVYACAIYPLGILNRLKKGEAYLAKQRVKIERLERRMENKAGETPK